MKRLKPGVRTDAHVVEIMEAIANNVAAKTRHYRNYQAVVLGQRYLESIGYVLKDGVFQHEKYKLVWWIRRGAIRWQWEDRA